MLHLLDTSDWQGQIDWEAVKAAVLRDPVSGATYKIDGAIQKIAEGLHNTVNNAVYNLSELKRLGMVRGVYDFILYTDGDPVGQANHYIDVARQLGVLGDPTVFGAGDFEQPESYYPGDQSAFIEAWAGVVNPAFSTAEYEFNHRFYSYPDWILHNMLDQALPHLGGLWLSSIKQTFEPQYCPNGCGVFPTTDLWQWTYHDQLPGITGVVDESVYYLDRPSFEAMCITPKALIRWELITSMHFRPYPSAGAKPWGALLPGDDKLGPGNGTRVAATQPPKGFTQGQNGFMFCRTGGGVYGWLLQSNMKQVSVPQPAS